MRGFIALCFCVAVYSLPDFSSLNKAGDVAALNAKALMSFAPLTIPSGHKLQSSSPCIDAWYNLGGLLIDTTDPCNAVLQVFYNLKNGNWTDAVIAYHLNNFCSVAGGCLAKYQTALTAVNTQCGPYATYIASAVFGNQTDQLYRTVNALVNAACMVGSTPTVFNAAPAVDPLTGTAIAATTYVDTYCWIHFNRLLSVNLSSTTLASDLDGVCTDCSVKITVWLNKNGLNQLAVSSKQALSFCDKKKDPTTNALVYCAVKVAVLQATATPAWQASIASTPTTAALDLMCNPCVKWGIQLSLRVEQLLHALNSTGYDPKIYATLSQFGTTLSYACMKDAPTDYCAVKLAQYSIAQLTTTFAPCINGTVPGCASTAATDACRIVIYRFYRTIGCCIVTFIKSLANAAPGSPAASAGTLVNAVLHSCGLNAQQLPSTCSQKKVHVTLPLRNVLYSYVQANQAAFAGWFAATVGIDVSAVVSASCVPATGGVATCTVVFHPDETTSADDWVASFNAASAAGTIFLTDFDIAPLSNDTSSPASCRSVPNQDAYNSSDFSSQSSFDCIQSQPPQSFTFNNSTGTCVNSCDDGIKNNDESDIDCGGNGCDPCPQNKTCGTNFDCAVPYICRSVCGSSCSKICTTASAGVALLANPLIVLASIFFARFFM